MRYGYKASSEQFAARPLLEYSVLAEELGFDTVAVADHFQPWRHHGGQAPFALSWLGALAQATSRVEIGTSVLTPTLRYQPAVVAQAFATLGSLAPGRVFLGVGTGEALNELPATGGEWPGGKERRRRLAEAMELIRRLWSEERVTFEGDYYKVARATIYERPPEPVPIWIAAGGPLAAKLAGRAGDGFICTSGKGEELYQQLLDAVGEGARNAGKDPEAITNMIEVKVSYDPDRERAERNCRWWGALALSGEQKSSIDDPVEMERAADAQADKASSRFIVSDDPEEVVEAVDFYAQLGFTELVFHHPGDDQRRALELFARDVLPRLRERHG
jgi:coenzyme F420-dependent glucose-6-phosphate dehydrogenase